MKLLKLKLKLKSKFKSNPTPDLLTPKRNKTFLPISNKDTKITKTYAQPSTTQRRHNNAPKKHMDNCILNRNITLCRNFATRPSSNRSHNIRIRYILGHKRFIFTPAHTPLPPRSPSPTLNPFHTLTLPQAPTPSPLIGAPRADLRISIS